MPRSLDEYLSIVIRTAKALRLVDAQGQLVPLDSLAVIDFVVALEAAAEVEIPSESLQLESFQSFESVAALLQRSATAAA